MSDLEQPADLPLEIATNALERQLASVDAADTKITNSSVIAAALVALLSAVAALRPERFKGQTVMWFWAAVAILGLTALCALIGLWARDWKTGAKAADVVSAYEAGTTENAVKWKAARTMITAVEANRGWAKWKARLVKISLACLAAEAMCVVVALTRIA